MIDCMPVENPAKRSPGIALLTDDCGLLKIARDHSVSWGGVFLPFEKVRALDTLFQNIAAARDDSAGKILAKRRGPIGRWRRLQTCLSRRLSWNPLNPLNPLTAGQPPSLT
jgi:hypothetical protein